MRYVVFQYDGVWNEKARKNLDRANSVKCGDLLQIDGSSTGSHYVFYAADQFWACDNSVVAELFSDACSEKYAGITVSLSVNTELPSCVIPKNGILQLNDAAFSVPAGSEITNYGSIQLNGDFVLTIEGKLINNGTIFNDAGGRIEGNVSGNEVQNSEILSAILNSNAA